MFAQFYQCVQCSHGDAGEQGCRLAAVVINERLGIVDTQLRQRLFDYRDIRQRHAHPRDARVGRDQWMQIVQIVGNQKTGEGQVGEWRFSGPIADHAG